jgi:hypothetical protein
MRKNKQTTQKSEASSEMNETKGNENKRDEGEEWGRDG